MATTAVRQLLAALLVLVAIGTFLLWAVLATVAIDATAKSLRRADAPGELTADLHPGVWNVHAEGGASITDIAVTEADGDPVDVTEGGDSTASWDRAGRPTEVAGSFEIPRGGMAEDVRIEVAGSVEPGGDGTFAVGAADEFDFLTIQRWGMLALLIVNLGAATVIIFTPLIRRRRHASAD